MLTVVTGAAGFIGSNLVKALNERGETDILAVDNLERADKFRNLVDCDICDFLDKRDFIEQARRGLLPRPAAVFHLGACSDTMATDGRIVMENNFHGRTTTIISFSTVRLASRCPSSTKDWNAPESDPHENITSSK